MKDMNIFTKNVLYLHGNSSEPLLCFSLVLVTSDNHEHGHTLGSESNEYVIKDITRVLPNMELEHFVAVIGLAYQLPYLPNDNLHRETDLLHFAMLENAFSFMTGMIPKNVECI